MLHFVQEGNFFTANISAYGGCSEYSKIKKMQSIVIIVWDTFAINLMTKANLDKFGL